MGTSPTWCTPECDLKISHTVLVRVTTTVMKHHEQGNLLLSWNTMSKATRRGKGLSQLRSITEEVRTGTQMQQEPWGRNWPRTWRDACLLPCSACFLIEPGTTCPGMVPPTVGWAFPHQLLIKNMPYRLVYSLVLWRRFLSWGFPLLDDSSFCQEDLTFAIIHP